MLHGYLKVNIGRNNISISSWQNKCPESLNCRNWKGEFWRKWIFERPKQVFILDHNRTARSPCRFVCTFRCQWKIKKKPIDLETRISSQTIIWIVLRSILQDLSFFYFTLRSHIFFVIFCFSVSVFIPERVLSYTAVDLTNVNVLLNSKDVSEYLKIAPSGLEVSTFL